ncbi:MAG: phosphoribosyl-AMP cyclohydrolase [Ardenticatenales bacterium]|nr:phosphoribosyl-AMP cyclohydrolase [Ardenticatenales bacterium]
MAPLPLAWNEQGLLPAIVQDVADGTVLMMAWMNREALAQTRARGEAVFWSRSRRELWHKGATSGNVMRVESIHYDCDGDTLLLRVWPAGPACHTGTRSCFTHKIEE